jgi:hypothetical protein
MLNEMPLMYIIQPSRNTISTSGMHIPSSLMLPYFFLSPEATAAILSAQRMVCHLGYDFVNLIDGQLMLCGESLRGPWGGGLQLLQPLSQRVCTAAAMFFPQFIHNEAPGLRALEEKAAGNM